MDWGDDTEAYAGELPDNWPEFPKWRWVRVGPLPYTSGLMSVDRMTMCIEELPLSPEAAAHFEKRLDACVAEQEELEIDEMYEREGKDWIERLRINAEVSKQIALDLREALPSD